MHYKHQDNEWTIDNIPNRLTVFRIALIPIIIIPLYLVKLQTPFAVNYETTLCYISAWTFVLASTTDFLDGYLARRWKLTTIFGSFFDPIADKFLVVSSMILLQGMNRIPTWIVIILVLRELYITSLRLLAQDKKITLPVNMLAKGKTISQMIAIPLLMAYDYPFKIPMPELGTFFIYVASILSIYSALEYSYSLIKKLRTIKRQKKNE